MAQIIAYIKKNQQAVQGFQPNRSYTKAEADAKFGSSSGGTPVDNEVVSGSGTTFTLVGTPVAGSVKVYALGQRIALTTDYSISGSVITTVSSWSAGDIVADYRT